MTALVSSVYEGLQRDPGQGSGCTLCEILGVGSGCTLCKILEWVGSGCTHCEIPSKAQGAHCESPGVRLSCLKVREFELILLSPSC